MRNQHRALLMLMAAAVCVLLLGAVKPRGLHPIAKQPGLGGLQPIQPGSWTTVTVIVSADTDYSDNEADSLKTGGGAYDYIVHKDNAPGEFRRGYVSMALPNDTSHNSAVDRVVIQSGTYWNDVDIAISMQYFPLEDLPGFFNTETEVLEATLTEFWRWANSPYITSSDTVYAIGGNRSDMLWWQYGTENSSKNYMWINSSTTWPTRNSSTNPQNWGPLGHTAVSTIPLAQHDYVTDTTPIINDPVSFDCLAWAQGQSNGDPNGGFWFLGQYGGSGQPTQAFNPPESTDAGANRPRLRLTYRYRTAPAKPQQLTLPNYASWSQRHNTESPLPSAYYDSLASVDISVMSPDVLEVATYDGMVDAVRTRNTDWIPLIYIWAYGIRNDWMSSSVGSLYRDLYDFINDTADDVEGDYWARDKSGTKIITHQPSYPDYNMLSYGKDGLEEGLAEIYIKHLNERGNLRYNVGFFVDWFEIPMRDWSCALDSLDLDQDGVAYEDDLSDENALLEKYAEAFPSVFRAAAGTDDFLIVANGTTCKNPLYAGLYDGCMYEGFWHYEPTNASEWGYLYTYASDLLDNSRVNPPILLMQAAHDSSWTTSEALATICLGTTVLGNEDRALDAIAPIFDAPTTRKHDFGVRVDGALWAVAADSILAAKFWDGTDTIFVRVQGYQDTSGDDDELGLPFPYEIIKDPSGTPSYLSQGSRSFR